jgi:hypothetical protein
LNKSNLNFDNFKINTKHEIFILSEF